MIKPTIGRVVWFHHPNTGEINPQPRAAIVAYVHSDRMVNLMVVDPNGGTYPKTSVVLRQPDEERPVGGFCEWMPYQQGQAAKTEALEKKLSETEK